MAHVGLKWTSAVIADPCVFAGWGSVVQEKDRIDVGWTSVFIKIGSEWLTGLLYCRVLIAPALFPDRDFS
jgi:hypothetical protein